MWAAMDRAVGRLSKHEFFERLRGLATAELPALERELGSEELTVLAADASGFTKTVQERGIVFFLAMMADVYRYAVPRLGEMGGTVLSSEADNLLAVFSEPEAALRAALDLQAWTVARNARVEAHEQFSLCLAVDHGPVLRLADDAFGNVVNVAYKIAEDLTRKDEILVTGRVRDRLGREFCCAPVRTERLGNENVPLFHVTATGAPIRPRS